MNENWNYKTIDDYRKCLKDYYSRYDFEWFVSMNLPSHIRNIDSHIPEVYLKKWRCSMGVQDHITICYMGNIITSYITGNHIHLLMSGRNKDDITLRDIDETFWERNWKDITKEDCKIIHIRDEGIIDYIVYNNTPINHFEPIIPYNEKLLKKCKKIQNLH